MAHRDDVVASMVVRLSVAASDFVTHWIPLCSIYGHSLQCVNCREFTKGGLAIYVFPLCNCNTLGSAFYVRIENMPNC